MNTVTLRKISSGLLLAIVFFIVCLGIARFDDTTHECQLTGRTVSMTAQHDQGAEKLILAASAKHSVSCSLTKAKIRFSDLNHGSSVSEGSVVVVPTIK